MQKDTEEYNGQRVEVRRDSRIKQWSVFMDGLLVDKVDTLFLTDAQFVVIESKARGALAKRRHNNASHAVRGTVAAAVHLGSRGLCRVHYEPTRSTTWLLVDYPYAVTTAPCALLQGNGDVLIPLPSTYTYRHEQGIKGRRPTRVTQAATARRLRAVGADFWLTTDQPLKNRVRLAEHGVFEPHYAILPNADPWHDTPLFFAKLDQVREWIAEQRALPPPLEEEREAVAPARPAEPIPLPFDMVSYYKSRVDALGWTFYPGRQPMDWADNGKLVYVLMEKNGPASKKWENFTFQHRHELEDWLYLREN